MKLIHTADWHLGKSLEGHSRLPEQKIFIDEFIEIVESECPDIVLIAGDIFDSGNPSAAAEGLYYDCMKRLTEDGNRLVAVVSGNHDSPERLAAPECFMKEHGVLVFSYPKQHIEKSPVGNFEIVESREGFVKININKEMVNLTAIPFPSERRLNELFANGDSEETMRDSYSDRVGKLFHSGTDIASTGDWNIALGHFFTLGGETTDSERPIQIGGGYSVSGNALPDFMDYIALGHLHRPQRIRANVVYAGSPLQYSKSEIGYSKAVFAIELKKGKQPDIREIFLRQSKPLEVWRVKGVGEALRKLEENRDRPVWVYLDIETDSVVPMDEIREMKKIRPDILAITPLMGETIESEEYEAMDMEKRNMKELFAEFYEQRNGTPPRTELVDLLKGILGDDEWEAADEAD
ncbi:MAG: exonuclease SbcCD subunit D [Peptostreptococcaceae bacterium]|nr:exonuclease SbcCD subunit D [Peptostreptococcaceae bacterium]